MNLSQQTFRTFPILIIVLTFSFAHGVVIKNDFKINQDTTIYTQVGYSVAFDGSGRFVVAYQDNGLDNDNHQIYFQRFDSLGSQIGSAVLVSDTHYQNSAADVAVHGSGWFVITWWRTDMTIFQLWEEDICAQIFSSSGSPLTPRFQVDVDRPSKVQDDWAEDIYPRIGMDSVGNFVIVWQGQEGNSPGEGTIKGVFCQRFLASGQRLDTNFRISSLDTAEQEYRVTSFCQFPNISVAADGKFAVTWMGLVFQPNDFTPLLRYYYANGNPLTKVRVGYLPRIEGQAGNNPDIYLTNTGRSILTWQGDDTAATYPNNAVMMRLLDSLGNYLSGIKVVIDVIDMKNTSALSFVCSDDSGNFLVTWSDRRNGMNVGRNLWAQRYDADANPVGSNFRINSIPNTLDGNWYGYSLDIYKNRVVFAWADWRNSVASGGDMYGKLMEMQDIGTYLPGDLNMSGHPDLADVIFLVNYILKGQTAPFPLFPADVNADCRVTLSDVISIVNYIFKPPWQLQAGCAY